jgi:bifunctional non-homologous end joining protein LigD
MASDKLSVYKARRDFSVTPEPADGGVEGIDGLQFVIQKHWATRLHYDLRLELDGTMKSWAVPKGPSYDTADKRMAVRTEDHPVSYNQFEGEIPARQYGAGKVIIWDKGTWHPIGDPHAGLEAGNLKFELHGHKMAGRWALIRIKGRDEKQEPWLLIKEKDAFVKPSSEFSVVDEFPDSVKGLKPPKGARPAAAAVAKKASAKGSPPHPHAVKAVLPDMLSPELATLVDRPQAGEWIYEIKFDGYRMLARVEGKDVRLVTRNGNDWTARLEPLRSALAKLKLPPGWYDGEIVVPGESGNPDFNALQKAFVNANTSPIQYYLFDAPYMAGYDLRAVPVEDRRAAVQAAFTPTAIVKFSAQFDAQAASLVASACKAGLEGIIGKRRGSPYVVGRSMDWIKIKCSQRQEFVIGGFTEPDGSRLGLGALLMGVYDDAGVLHFAGKVGTGFSGETLADLRKQLDPLSQPKRPFAEATGHDRQATWVKPQLVADIVFAQWTPDGHIRHASFQSLRTDKPATEIRRERPGPSAGAKLDDKASAPLGVKVSNPERVIDATTGLTKLDLVAFYAGIADWILPHLKSRPVSLVRAPQGIAGQLFFQKHLEHSMPGATELDPGLWPDHTALIGINSREALLSAAQMNVVEFHTWNSLVKNIDKPDRLIFDLDPGEGVSWKAVQEAAGLMQTMLAQLKLQAWLKTSGGKGLHVVVPLAPKFNYAQVKGFSQAVVQHMALTLPSRFVARSGGANRIGKIFIDYLRNGHGQTTAAAFSARARPGLGVSMPISWEALAGLKSGAHWTIKTALEHLQSASEDPWAGYWKSRQPLAAAMKAIGYDPAPAD